MRLLISVPILIVLVLFALSNKQDVALAFWPTDYRLVVPLSLAVLVPVAVAFLLGLFFASLGTLGARSRARRAELRAQVLEDQVRSLKTTPARQPLPAPQG
ncbi:MAG TPA: LapA family protein [Acidisphaera sp.]|nr:LapA family protein [Acidisphaera sp.]